MKSKATIIWVDKPSTLPDNTQLFKHKFCDTDGIVGLIYTVKKPFTVGETVNIRLEQDGDSFKFKIDK